jgi:cyclin L
MRYAPETICCAALWMGARVLQIKLPSDGSPPWWELFDAKKEEMDAVCARVAALYSRGRAEFVDLIADASAAPPPAS